jgi:hypothetical protein
MFSQTLFQHLVRVIRPWIDVLSRVTGHSTPPGVASVRAARAVAVAHRVDPHPFNSASAKRHRHAVRAHRMPWMD